MKNISQRWWVMVSWLALQGSVLAAAGLLQLRPGLPIAGIDPGDQAIPCVTDWNGDGLMDLLVGYQAAGKIAVYLNSGTAAAPVFSGFANLSAGDNDIYHYSGGCGAPAPWVCDYDGDGRRDLLVGTGQEGWVVFYRNSNTDAEPILEPGVKLLAGGTLLGVTYRATPYVCDWDHDGRPDLLCGNGDGCVYFFKNTNTAAAPVYLPGVQMTAGGRPLSFGSRSAVRMFDWDGDGLGDLVGSAGGVAAWCRNLGSATNPVLAAPVPLTTPAASGSLVAINTGYRMRLELADWNHDGVMDLLIGNADGTVNYYEGYYLRWLGAGPAAGGRLRLNWASAPYRRYRVLSGATPDSMTNQAGLVPSAGTLSTWETTPTQPQQFYRIVEQ